MTEEVSEVPERVYIPVIKVPEKVYISGPMTGLPDFNRPAFHAAAAQLRQAGYEVRNPADVRLGPDATWSDYMRVDLPMLLECDLVALLPGWHKSRGARLEYTVATDLGIRTLSLHLVLREGEARQKTS